MKILVLLADGFEEIEALTPVDLLRRANAEVVTLSITENREVTGSHGVKVVADGVLTGDEKADAIVLPGGLPGSTNLAADAAVRKIVSGHFADGKLVSAICAAPLALEASGILGGKDYTCYPGIEERIENGNYRNAGVVVDGNLVTGRGPGYAMEFALTLIGELLGEEKKEEIAAGLLLREE